MEKNILNRVEINIKDCDSLEVYNVFQDWLTMTKMKEQINIKPNVVEFDFIPGYKFHKLRLKKEEINEHPLTIKFECDFWEKI